jgi:FkbM family methyltransferase
MKTLKAIIEYLRTGLFFIRSLLWGKLSKVKREYIKLQLSQQLFCDIFRIRKNKEAIFGFEIVFSNYSDLLRLYLEIFLKESYYFMSESKEPLIIDCGANIGISVLYFKMLFPASKVIGFEPDENNFALLKTNIINNKLKGITLINKAVYNHEGVIDFFRNQDSLDSVTMTTVRGRFKEAFCGKVECVVLSEFIQQEVELLKLDIEGAEVLVLEELAKKGKLKLVKNIIIEYHHHAMPTTDSLSGLFLLLENNNFGYQLNVSFEGKFIREGFQDILVFAYRKPNKIC